MIYLSISFTHKNTDIHTREKLSFSNEYIIDNFLTKLTNHRSINEAVLLSTCNRVEIITSVVCEKEATDLIIEELSLHSGLLKNDLSERADIFDNKSAIHHLFSVASSLDSLVIGETQIVGQLKDAFKNSITKGYCGKSLSRAFHYAFKCAASVRNATSLGTGSVSVSSTAVMKAKTFFEDTNGVEVLVIGAGEMSRLAIKHLITNNFRVTLINRSFEKAKELASEFEDAIIDVKPFEAMPELINKVPVLISATSAPEPIIKQSMVKYSEFERFWFDIAVPKDIDKITEENIQVFYVDDLQDIVDKNMEVRAKNAKVAFSIVGKLTSEFFVWLKSLEVEPMIKNMYLKSDDIIEQKLEKAIKKGFIDIENAENIKKLCESIMAEFLHNPTKELRNISKTIDGDNALNTIGNIFDLSDNSNDFKSYECE